jgi:hypothetical protein
VRPALLVGVEIGFAIAPSIGTRSAVISFLSLRLTLLVPVGTFPVLIRRAMGFLVPA